MKYLPFLFGILTSCIAVGQTIPVIEIGQMSNTISEPSGLSIIYNTSNGHFEYWANNDYDNPDEIYGMRIDNLSNIQRSITVNQTYIDWEDMAKDDNNNIYLGDFGNWVGANDLQIIKIGDPNSYGNSPPVVDVIEYVYPTNGVADSEGLIHFGGSLYVFTKSVNSNANPNFDEKKTYCYKIPDSPLMGGASHTAVLMDSHQVIFAGEDPTHFKVTAADLSPDKKKLVLMTYERIWVFSCFDGDDFFGGTQESFLIPYRQYEGVAFVNNHEIVITKEGDAANPNYNPKAFYIDLYPYIDGACIDCEKAINGNFDEVDLAWKLFEYGNGTASLNTSGGNAVVDIQNLGTSQWHINIRHKSLILENGKSYRVRYKAHADDAREISVIANKSDGSVSYNYKSQQITTTPTYYSHDFTMNEATDYNSYLSFNIGKFFAHKVYFDDISLVELDCICPTERSFYAEIDNTNEQYETSNVIKGFNLISGNDIKYDAGNCVELNVGFEVVLGAIFEAFIDGCDGN